MKECLICFEEMNVSKDRLYECIYCFKHIHIYCYKDWEKQQKKIQLSNHNMQLLYNNDYYDDAIFIQNTNISKPNIEKHSKTYQKHSKTCKSIAKYRNI